MDICFKIIKVFGILFYHGKKKKPHYADLTKCWKSSSSLEAEPSLQWTRSQVSNDREAAVVLLGALLAAAG